MVLAVHGDADRIATTYPVDTGLVMDSSEGLHGGGDGRRTVVDSNGKVLGRSISDDGGVWSHADYHLHHYRVVVHVAVSRNSART